MLAFCIAKHDEVMAHSAKQEELGFYLLLGT